jgi:hypothetical protein
MSNTPPTDTTPRIFAPLADPNNIIVYKASVNMQAQIVVQQFKCRIGIDGYYYTGPADHEKRISTSEVTFSPSSAVRVIMLQQRDAILAASALYGQCDYLIINPRKISIEE